MKTLDISGTSSSDMAYAAFTSCPNLKNVNFLRYHQPNSVTSEPLHWDALCQLRNLKRLNISGSTGDHNLLKKGVLGIVKSHLRLTELNASFVSSFGTC